MASSILAFIAAAPLLIARIDRFFRLGKLFTAVDREVRGYYYYYLYSYTRYTNRTENTEIDGTVQQILKITGE